jgi:hypothetical protein
MIALIVIPLVLILAGGSIGGLFYMTQVRPKQELEKWGRELGAPTGMTLYNGDWVDGSHRYFALYRVVCTATTRCTDPTPVESVTQYLKDAGDTGIDEKTVADCFRSVTNCQRLVYRDGHKAVFTIEETSVLGNQFDLKVELYWST